AVLPIRQRTDWPPWHSVFGWLHDIGADFRLACRAHVALADHWYGRDFVERCGCGIRSCCDIFVALWNAAPRGRRRRRIRPRGAGNDFRLLSYRIAWSRAFLFLRRNPGRQRDWVRDWRICDFAL